MAMTLDLIDPFHQWRHLPLAGGAFPDTTCWESKPQDTVYNLLFNGNTLAIHKVDFQLLKTVVAFTVVATLFVCLFICLFKKPNSVGKKHIKTNNGTGI